MHSTLYSTLHIGDPIGVAYGGATSRVMFQKIMRLLKRLHGLCKSSGVVSCIASLPIDSLHMVSYYCPYIATLCVKCTVFEILTTYLSKIA